MLGKQKTPPNISFGKVLRQLRKEAGLSQEQLALEAEIQRNYISLIELGRNQPTITTIFKLAHALGIKPSKLVHLVEEISTASI
jgi:transcriptional regulator with XRE-family HTH domain